VDDRYSRQQLVPGIGERGQEAIGSSSVAIVGLGATGSHLAELMVRAGVGRVVLIDRDKVETSNLQRTALYTEVNAIWGHAKVAAAARHLTGICRGAAIEKVQNELSPGSAVVLDGVKLVLDGTDNWAARFLINDWCVKKRVPWIYTAAERSAGAAAFFHPDRSCLRCLHPENPPGDESCDLIGVLAPAARMATSWAASWALHYLASGATPEAQFVTFDMGQSRFFAAGLARVPGCRVCEAGEYDYLEGRAWYESSERLLRRTGAMA
jgi:molybdopterin/thiamine biosynthesis adenylyltransferase